MTASPVCRFNAILIAVAIALSAAASASRAAEPKDKDALRLAGLIDRGIEARLATAKVRASGPASDAEFIRRVYLDIHGTIPPVERVSAFLDSNDPKKKAKLIDELLADPQFGAFLADIWTQLLVPPRDTQNRAPVWLLRPWLEEQFNQNKAWDRLAFEMLTAEGEDPKQAPGTVYWMNDSGVLSPAEVTDLVVPLFLGVRIQCAQCHDHPFADRWKKSDYWGVAAFFTRLKRGRGVVETAGLVEDPKVKPVLPANAKIVPPKFPQGEKPSLDSAGAYRPAFASWATARDNPFFARAMVNRVWAHLFGRGLVNPVDDLDSAPSHPELLENLADQFAESGFDLKHLIRAICNSQAYQRTSNPADGTERDPELICHRAVRLLTPEQLFDALVTLTLLPKPSADVKGKRQREEFVRFFRTANGASPLEYSRGIPQLLRVMNTPQFRAGEDALLRKLAASSQTPAEVVEHLFLMFLSRRPSPRETEHLLDFVQKAGKEPLKAYADIAWALRNSSEFTLNH